MAQENRELYKIQNPSNLEAMRIQEDLRKIFDKIALDNGTDFYDKLYTLEATQRGVFSKYRTNPIVEKFDRARRELVMLTISHVLVVGSLAPENPWTFLDISEKGESTKIDLGVRFSKAFKVSDTQYWLHESYGQCSQRSQTGPSVEPISSDWLAVGLPVQPVGSEQLYTKVEAYSNEIFSSPYKIHQRIIALQRDEDELRQAALHGAVSEAIFQLGQ